MQVVSSRLEPGKLIVFEGADGAGKSTLAQSLVGWLKELRIKSEYAAFPGTSPGTIGQVIYEIHHDPGRFGVKELSAASLQALHIAAHLDAIERAILPALSDGTWVILDRFWWSTWVYGCVSGANRSVLDAMIDVERLQWDDTLPDMLFLLERADGPTSQDFEEHRAAYRTLYDAERSRYPVRMVQNDRLLSDTVSEILKAVDEFVGGT